MDHCWSNEMQCIKICDLDDFESVFSVNITNIKAEITIIYNNQYFL